MHIIIAFITAVAGLIWALNSLQNAGFDLNALNPFTWYRRRQWASKLGAKPLYNLTRPMEVAAAVLIGAAILEGEISREQKLEILGIFRNEFNLSKGDAMELFSASSYLLRDEDHLTANLAKVLERARPDFTEELSASLINLVKQVSNLDGEASASQLDLIAALEQNLLTEGKERSKWG